MRSVVNIGWTVLAVGWAILITALSSIRGSVASPGGMYFALALPAYGLVWALLFIVVYRVWCSGRIALGRRMELTVVTTLVGLGMIGFWGYRGLGLAMLYEVLADAGGLMIGFGLIRWWQWWQRALRADQMGEVG